MTCVPRPGTRGRGVGVACARTHVPCTVLARWEDGDKAPWLLLTELPPEASEAGWEGLRAWSAQGFQITKRAGWPGHRTRRSHPERAARLWLAVAVATWWRLRVGGAADEPMPASPLLDVTALCPGRPRTRRATRLRLVSVCRQGWVRRLVALLRQDPWPEALCARTVARSPRVGGRDLSLLRSSPEAARGRGTGGGRWGKGVCMINTLDIIANNHIDQKVVELSSSQRYSLGENSMYRSVFLLKG
jgi:hypothetical protein